MVARLSSTVIADRANEEVFAVSHQCNWARIKLLYVQMPVSNIFPAQARFLWVIPAPSPDNTALLEHMLSCPQAI